MRVQAALFAFVALVCSGCPQDPAETVTLHFSGDTETTELVLDRIIPRLLDQKRMTTVTYQHAQGGLATRATVSPVSDVELFVSRCSFGEIVRRENRELWVSVDPAQTHATVTNYWIADRAVELLACWTFVRSVATETFITAMSKIASKIAITTR